MSKLQELIRQNQVNNKIDMKYKNRVKTTTEIEARKKSKEKRKSYNFMAFAIGEDINDAPSYARYWGVGSIAVLGINPTAEEIMKWTGRQEYDLKDYLGTQMTNDGEVPSLRIDIWYKTHIGKEEYVNKISYFIRKQYLKDSTGQKMQVIDKFNRTCWLTPAEFSNKQKPVYSNGPAKIDINSYRPALNGEADIITFFQAFLGQPETDVWDRDNNMFIENPHIDKCECRIENPDALWRGDVSELVAMVKAMPDNECKVCFGIKTTPEGKQYMDFYRGRVARWRENPQKGVYTRFKKAIEKDQQNGRYATTEFYFGDMTEYKVTPTELQPASAPAPMPTPEAEPFQFAGPDDASKFPWE